MKWQWLRERLRSRFLTSVLAGLYNPRNDKIQAFYHHEPMLRTRPEFLQLLRDHSKSIVLE